jgi:transposase
MGNRQISYDLKRAALRLRARGRDSTSQITQICGFSRSTFFRTLQRQRLTGDITRAAAVGRGRPRALLHTDCHYLIQLAHHKPTLFLDEYANRLERYHVLPTSLTTIHRSFQRAGLNVKHVQKLAAERDPELRAQFIHCVSQYPINYLITIDEVSKDDQTYARLWGRAAVGARVEVHQPFVRKRRLSMCAAMVLDEGIVALRVLEGSFTHETFLKYLWDDVVSWLLSFLILCLNIPIVTTLHTISWSTQHPCNGQCPHSSL